MSGHDSEDVVGIEMDELENEVDPGDPGDQPMEDKVASTGSPFKDMFESILTAYDDERTWWVAVENLLKTESGEFATKVTEQQIYIQTRA